MKRYLLLLAVLATSCNIHGPYEIDSIQGKQLHITDSISGSDSISAFIQPYKQSVDKEMNMVLSYSPFNLAKNDGQLNTAIGNMMADAVMELSNPVFEKRTGNAIDIVLLNYGGIRSAISKGNITTRTAFEVMPFENEIVIAALSGKHVREMANFLIDAGTAHPLAGLELEIAEDNFVKKILVNGTPLQDEKTYYVATNDYLLQGGDNMVFFKNASEVIELDYKIRNLLIDYFRKRDTVAPVRDQRFIKVP